MLNLIFCDNWDDNLCNIFKCVSCQSNLRISKIILLTTHPPPPHTAVWFWCAWSISKNGTTLHIHLIIFNMLLDRMTWSYNNPKYIHLLCFFNPQMIQSGLVCSWSGHRFINFLQIDLVSLIMKAYQCWFQEC